MGMRNLIAKFAREEDGAALIEYTVLLGIIAATVIVTIIGVGTWIDGQWTTFSQNIGASAPPAPPPAGP
jgi:pilus assembly protein Flp/PilA